MAATPEASVPPVSERELVHDHVVEIVSDSGEGAQKCGQIFAAVSARMGNGVWTVEIIPAEIKPPARSRAGASGIRVRLGDRPVTNMGDQADVVIAFNEQVLYGRIKQNAYRPGTTILLEESFAESPVPEIKRAYAEALELFEAEGFRVVSMNLEELCRPFTERPRVGKNMFALGVLCQIYGRDLEAAAEEVAIVFGRKGQPVVDINLALLKGGYAWAAENVSLRLHVPARVDAPPMVVMNGNQAMGLGVMAAGIEMVSMYPITPATSASHYLAEAIERVGGVVHQAEDEIAAIGFAIGASYAGRTACTITSGPGLALKTEFLGLAVMAEVPLVIGLVQRGGPSTGLPTKVEQGDLLATLFGTPGDAPKVVLAAATIEECFHFVVTARKLAEAFRTPAIVLTDANLATGVAPFPRPNPEEAWLSPPVDLSPWQEGVEPYAWDPDTGLSPRPVPGQAGGEYVLTGLAHTAASKVAYDPESNQLGCDVRSRKLGALQSSLKPPAILGEPEGELLIVGWGSTLGAIEEAVERLQADGHAVSSLHLRFLSPMEPGLAEIFARFRRVMTIEINYSDELDAPQITAGATRRRSQLAQLLRAETLVDVDCWSVVHGQPLGPAEVARAIHTRLPTSGPGARVSESRGES